MSIGGERYVLTVTCPDVAGILAGISGFLSERNGFILESKQYSDPDTNRFFLRLVFVDAGANCLELDQLRIDFDALAQRFGMSWSIKASGTRPRVLIAVSRHGHCLNDLLHRWHSGNLPVDIVAVVSNHNDMRRLTEWNEIPYHHLPVTPDTKPQQEARLLEIMREAAVDLVVLARYMQVLSPELCSMLSWRCINIHHSFLPSFKGAKPYHQAHARGVKIIGATAHYVTSDLDEGPIIEQDVERVDHELGPGQLTQIGRDIEARVLARAVHWHAEGRVLPNGSKTVVFR